jgi:hypothetical protein
MTQIDEEILEELLDSPQFRAIILRLHERGYADATVLDIINIMADVSVEAVVKGKREDNGKTPYIV